MVVVGVVQTGLVEKKMDSFGGGKIGRAILALTTSLGIFDAKIS